MNNQHYQYPSPPMYVDNNSNSNGNINNQFFLPLPISFQLPQYVTESLPSPPSQTTPFLRLNSNVNHPYPLSSPSTISNVNQKSHQNKDYKFILHTYEHKPQQKYDQNIQSVNKVSSVQPYQSILPQHQQPQQQQYPNYQTYQDLSLSTSSMVPIPGCMAYHHPLIPIIPSVLGNTRKSIQQRDGVIHSNDSMTDIKKLAFGSPVWNEKDDLLLKDLKDNQHLGWRDISMYFPGRTISACQFRWRRMNIKEANRKKRELKKSLINQQRDKK